jgi:hypothetical protein
MALFSKKSEEAFYTLMRKTKGNVMHSGCYDANDCASNRMWPFPGKGEYRGTWHVTDATGFEIAQDF